MNKAFTLIELLVVVAIIGILAAVGVVSFSGFTESAKVSATKQINAQTIKYAKAEIMKCKLGASTAMSGYLQCNPTSSNTPYQSWRGPTANLFAMVVMDSLTNESGVFKDTKNPYNNSLPAIRSRPDYEVGQVSISVIDTNLQIKTCYRSGCATADTSLVLISTTD
jgi:type IV pilus assembly protein PilA